MTLTWNCETGGCYKDRQPDWGILDGCFPRDTIKVSDIDGWVHLANPDRFLMLEHKQTGATLKPSQIESYKALMRQGGNFTVLGLRGDGPRDVQQMIWWPEPRGWIAATVDDLCAVVCEWGREKGRLDVGLTLDAYRRDRVSA